MCPVKVLTDRRATRFIGVVPSAPDPGRLCRTTSRATGRGRVMTHHHRSDTTGAGGTLTLERAAAAAAPMVTATIPVGSESDAVAANPLTGSVYVTNVNGGTVSVISGRTSTGTATIVVGSRPISVAVNPPTGD